MVDERDEEVYVKVFFSKIVLQFNAFTILMLMKNLLSKNSILNTMTFSTFSIGRKLQIVEKPSSKVKAIQNSFF